MVTDQLPGRLWILDDYDEIRALVRTVAESLQWEVTELTRGEELKQAWADSQAPDLILLDIVMPDMDGIEVIRWLADEGYRGRLVLMSGYSTEYTELAERLGDARSLDISDVLQKPMDLADLQRALAPH